MTPPLTKNLRRQSWKRTLEVVDSHTCGQPTRVIISGTSITPGMKPREAQTFLEKEAPWVRRTAILEPRGHRSMFGAALIAPASAGRGGGEGEGNWGVVFIDALGYPDMCGHATIGTATTLIELGLIEPDDKDNAPQQLLFHLETPAGTIELSADIDVGSGRVKSVSFQTPLAYFVGSVELPATAFMGDGKEEGIVCGGSGSGSGSVIVDVAHGGQYYAFVSTESIAGRDLNIVPDDIDKLIAAAERIRKELAWQLSATKLIDQRTKSAVPAVGNIVWTTNKPQSPHAHARNIPISAAGSFDRSPCGTATCARMATLVAKGQLSVGQDFVNESILGTHYVGQAVAPHSVIEGGIVPRVTGSAWVTAHSQLLVDYEDPLGGGYLIGGGEAVI